MIRSLLHPGPPPRAWVVRGATLLAASATLCAALAAAGWYFRGEAGQYFGEKLIANSVSGGLLLASAATCGLVARTMTATNRRFARFWVWSAVLFGVAGMDELFRLHERLDVLVHHAAGLDPANPLTDHLDDLIVASYALPALLLWYRHRADLVRLRWMVLTLAVAFAGFCLMVVLDITGGWTVIEDSAKILSGTLILIAFLSVAYEPQPGTAEADEPFHRHRPELNA